MAQGRRSDMEIFSNVTEQYSSGSAEDAAEFMDWLAAQIAEFIREEEQKKEEAAAKEAVV